MLSKKEIGRQAGKIFKYKTPANWAIRSQEDQEDYGIDAEIELIGPQEKATGFIFKVQIKGQSSVNIINNGKYVSYELSVKHLNYYMNQIEIPTIFLIVDITTEKVYWKNLLSDEELRKQLHQAIDEDQDNISIHLETINTLPEKTTELLTSVENDMNWLKLNALNRLTKPINRLIKFAPDNFVEKMLEKTKALNFHLISESFARLFINGEFEQLLSNAKKVFDSQTEKIETRLCAGLYIDKVYIWKFKANKEGLQKERSSLFLEIFKIIKKEKAPKSLKLYTMLLLRSLKLNSSVDIDYQCFVTEKIAEHNNISKYIADSFRYSAILIATKNVEKTIHLINRIIYTCDKFALVELLPRVCIPISIFALRLKEDGLHESSDYLFSWLKYCIELGIKISIQEKDDFSLFAMIILNATFKFKTDDATKYLDESLHVSEKITDSTKRTETISFIAKMRSELNSTRDSLLPEEEIAIFRERARAYGIKIDNQGEMSNNEIQQGLIDYNPERVLKDCKNLFVFPSRNKGYIARIIGLPTATHKFIYCLEKKESIGGWSLDEIYESPIKECGFKQNFCEGCQFKASREENWHWTSKWQYDEEQKHKEIISKIDH